MTLESGGYQLVNAIANLSRDNDVEVPDEVLRNTPRRVGKAYDELTSGYRLRPGDVLEPVFEEKHHELVLVRKVAFASLCEHHLLPFVGYADVAYIPNGKGIVGLSKLARLVHVCTRRMTVQERATTLVADTLVAKLEPTGVMVMLEAEHMCMTIRGVQAPGTTTVTSAVRGAFLDNPAARAEVMALCRS